MSEDDATPVLSVLLAGSGVVLAGLVVELALRLGGKVLIARLLGRTDFGSVAVGFTLAGVAATVAAVGMGTGVARYLPRSSSPEHRRGVVISALRVALPVAVLAAAAVVVAAEPLARSVFGDPALAPVLVATAVSVPFAVLFRVAVGTLQGQKRTRPKVLLENLALPLVRLGGFAAAVAFGLGALGVAWAYTGAVALVATLALAALLRSGPLLGEATPARLHRELLDFSAPVMGRKLMAAALVHLDTFLLGALATLGAVGVYNAVYPLAMLVTLAHKAADYLYLPLVSELDADSRSAEVEVVYLTATKWLFVATLPVFLGVAVFPEAVISLTYGAEYVPGATALSVLAVGFLVHSVVGINGGTLEAIGATRFVMVASAVVAVVNAALNVVLIPAYAYLGAAAATTLSYLLLNALYSAHLYRLTGVLPAERSMAPLGGAAAVVAVALVGVRLVAGPGLVVALAAVPPFGLAYGVVVARYGLAESDFRVLADVEEEFGVDLGRLRRAARSLARV